MINPQTLDLSTLPSVPLRDRGMAISDNSIIELSQSIMERLDTNRLTRVPLLYLNELPPISGVYFVTTEDNKILSIGNVSSFATLRNICATSELLPAIEKGAVFLLLAKTPIGAQWFVAQWLINKLSPPLNKTEVAWWRTLDPLSLPSVALRDRQHLPSKQGIYFVVDSGGTVQYVGRSNDIKGRWASQGHHKYCDVVELKDANIHYLLIEDSYALKKVEIELIRHHNPQLNERKRKPKNKGEAEE